MLSLFDWLSGEELYCENCLWYYKTENICTHRKKKKDSPLFDNVCFCEYRFDLKLNRDFDIDMIKFVEKNFPEMIRYDFYANKYIQG